MCPCAPIVDARSVEDHLRHRPSLPKSPTTNCWLRPTLTSPAGSRRCARWRTGQPKVSRRPGGADASDAGSVRRPPTPRRRLQLPRWVHAREMSRPAPHISHRSRRQPTPVGCHTPTVSATNVPRQIVQMLSPGPGRGSAVRAHAGVARTAGAPSATPHTPGSTAASPMSVMTNGPLRFAKDRCVHCHPMKDYGTITVDTDDCSCTSYAE